MQASKIESWKATSIQPKEERRKENSSYLPALPSYNSWMLLALRAVHILPFCFAGATVYPEGGALSWEHICGGL